MTVETVANEPRKGKGKVLLKPMLAIHLAGFLSCVVYGLLSWKSRGVEPVGVAVFFTGMAAVWTFLLIVFQFFRCSKDVGGLARPVSRSEQRWVWVILFWALCFRITGILASPILAEDDYFRFMWDGYQFAETGTPYGKAPADFFEEDGLPDAVESLLYDINYPELPTIYGPVMEVVFLASYLIKPASLLVLKCLFVLFEGLMLYFLSQFLNVRWLLAAAWCPLLIFETSFQAHPDIIGVAFLCGAIWACRRERSWTAMGFLALATCAKPFAILVWPFIVARGKWFRQGMLFAAMLAAIYLPFIFTSSDAGGYSLGAMAQHWEFNSLGYALLKEIFNERARAASLLIFGVIYLFLLIRFRSGNSGDEVEKAPLDLVYGSFFLVSPVINPWYLLWLLPFVMLRPKAWSVIALAVVSLSYATGLNLGDGSLEEFEIPVWIKWMEAGFVGLGVLYSTLYHSRANGCLEDGIEPVT